MLLKVLKNMLFAVFFLFSTSHLCTGTLSSVQILLISDKLCSLTSKLIVVKFVVELGRVASSILKVSSP